MHKHRSQGPDIRSFCLLIAEFQPFCRLEHLPILGHTIMFGGELQIGQFPRAPPLKNPAHAPVVIYLSRAQVMYLHVSTSQRARVMYLHVSTSQSAHVMNLPVSTSQRAQVMYLPVSTSQRAPVMYNVQACAGHVFTCLNVPECAGHVPRRGHNLVIVQKPAAGQVTEKLREKRSRKNATHFS